MTSSPTPTPVLVHFRPRPWAGYPAAIAVIFLMFCLGLFAAGSNSQTFDEGAHLVGGYIHWTLGHPHIHTENGYLAQAIESLPLLMMYLRLPAESSYAFTHPQPFTLGREFLYNEGNDFAHILFWGRAAIGVLTALTGLTVYAWSRKLYGAPGGILSLLLFALSPLVLAHGFLATSDMAATCFFALSLLAFFSLLQRVTLLRFLAASVALAALFLSKMSAPLILPALFLLALLPPLPNAIPLRTGKRLVRNVLLLLALVLAVWFLIYAAYGFTFSAMKDSPRGSSQGFWPDGQWFWALDHPNFLLHAIAFARDHHLLPESFLYGYAYVVQTGREVVSFANGETSSTGWWWFYPFVVGITTPLPILVLIVGALAVALWRARKFRAQTRQRLLATAPLTLFIATYFLSAILSYRGSGPRHLLPLLPCVCILLGSAAHWTLPFRRAPLWLTQALPAAMLLWLALENAAVYPHYLSYVNELAGGPRHAYRHLVDSAVDWGQDLPALSTYLAQNVPPGREGQVYFSYFGSADPAPYGIHAQFLPSFLSLPEEQSIAGVPTLRPGLYCISVTMLQNLYNHEFPGAYTPAYEQAYQIMLADLPRLPELLRTVPMGSPNSDLLRKLPERFRTLRLARLCAFLRQQEPAAQAGYSINIYEVSAAMLDRALNGPPPYADDPSGPH